MYNPAIARFIQPDPIGYADGMNMYAYCGNNPVNYIDPWGLEGKEEWGGSGTYKDPYQIDDEDLLNAMAGHYGEKLQDMRSPRDLEGSGGDTIFHDYGNTHKWFIYEGQRFKGEEVNYIGVGAGFAKFRMTRLAAIFGPIYWNRVIHKGREKDGELFFSYYGYVSAAYARELYERQEALRKLKENLRKKIEQKN